MTSFDGAVVLLTGAAGGFGTELIRLLLPEGARLILSDRDTAAVERAVAQAAHGSAARGSVLGIVPADLGTPDGCAALYEQARAIAPIDVLINNAGIGGSGPFHQTPHAYWDAMLRVNLIAAMHLTWLASPDMIARQRGHIVNISSSAGLATSANLTAYTASKWGLRGFGAALAGELAPYGVRITTIYPFFARTPILQSPSFGPQQASLPMSLTYDSAFVMRKLVAGVKANRRDIYPGFWPHLLHIGMRVSPTLLSRVLGGGRRSR